MKPLSARYRRAARTLLATLTLATSPMVWSGVDVGVGVTIRQPGVYGRIEVGTRAPPPVIYRQPVLIAPPRVVLVQPEPPLYLYVPPGHAKKWHKHCHRYGACGRQVYFVREQWVQAQYRQSQSRQSLSRQSQPGKGPPVLVQGRGPLGP